MSFLVDDMIIYVKSLKELAKKILELISNYDKFAGYRLILKKSISGLYTCDEQVEFETENMMSFICEEKLQNG